MTAQVVGLSPGAMIDGFKVIDALGDGGFGLVYLVEKHGKLYALKLARHREASLEKWPTSGRWWRTDVPSARAAGHERPGHRRVAAGRQARGGAHHHLELVPSLRSCG